MKRKSLLYIASLLILFGCDYNDKYFDGLDDLTKPGDIKQVEYTLLDEDYAKIAGYTANKDLAAEAGVTSELSSLGTNKRFSETLSAKIYLPAFLSDKWYTADERSAIKVTYNNYLNAPEYVRELNRLPMYKLTADDYATVWGAGSSTNYFTPANPAATHMPAILLAAQAGAEEGKIIAVDYNQSEQEPGAGSVIAIDEDFSSATANQPIVLEGWHNVTTTGNKQWEGRSYSGNSYMNASAYQHTAGELNIYMITPQFKVTEGLNLTFDACYGNYKEAGGRLSVLVSTNLAGFTPAEIADATWDDITSSFTIEIPSGNYGTLAPAGSHNLNTYVGKDVYIAFKYSGDGNNDATTTVQVDNISVTGATYDLVTALYQFDGTEWAAFSGNAYMMTSTDYLSMGIRNDNFNSAVSANDYLPAFLKLKYPFAQVDDYIAVVYKYAGTSSTSIYADEYIYSGTDWVKNSYIEVVTDQFVLTEEGWKYDPSVVITLNATRNDPVSTPFYQTITDWVKENHAAMVTTYGNNDYYYGGSAYQNNFDFRPSAWKAQSNSEYGSMTDAELIELMFERLPESFPHALEVLYSDANLAEGINVIYTINFYIYDGSSTTPYTIQYLVVAKGKFEYVKDSLKKVE